MAEYKGFIPQNVAVPGARRIGIYNDQGNRMGVIPLGNLAMPNVGQKLYAFGVLSDVHLQYETAKSDFIRALNFMNNAPDVLFTCICGDLTQYGNASELEEYQSCVNTYAEKPVYAITGNHDVQMSGRIETYTANPLYYSFAQGEDVFVMVGIQGNSPDQLFSDVQLQWLQETLEANRNKRCFVFEHVFPWGDSGNPRGLYPFDIFSGAKGSAFQSLLRHYGNTVLFHGHSHSRFQLQEADPKANYSQALGYRSVHISSLAVPRDIAGNTLTDVYGESEGYLVDVYENGIHLMAVDFLKDRLLPIASYWLDTGLKMVEAGSYRG